ncbi:hypothetical protein [uncultured Dechloromonas sp.]|uniref:hypothetical protein n=1 Tax=uncultured Dechloromonas sp. TaxID=171719 RepID=UPI0025D2D2B1|nr:hypothetical protein [uncultured Dechloromonas sp.]
MQTEKDLLDEVKSKLDQLPGLYRDKVSEVMDPLIELCERILVRLDEFEEEFDRG